MHTLLFIRNSFIRNLYWESQMAKELSVLKPRRLRNLHIFLSLFYCSFEDTFQESLSDTNKTLIVNWYKACRLILPVNSSDYSNRLFSYGEVKTKFSVVICSELSDRAFFLSVASYEKC